jgi:hypothetical protein
MIEAQAIANEPGNSVVRIGASFHTLIAACAAIQIENQKALRIHQTLAQKVVDRDILQVMQSTAVLFDALVRNGFQTYTHPWETCEHLAEIVAPNAHELHVVERGTGSGPNPFV